MIHVKQATRQRSLLIESHPLQVIPELAKLIGLNEAIVLQQVHYWMSKSDNQQDGRKFVYKTVEQWKEEFPFWSAATIKRTIGNLKRCGLLILSKREATSWDRTNWYTVGYDALNSLSCGIGSLCTNALDQSELMHQVKVTPSIGSICADRSAQSEPMSLLGTESTTETTAKNRRRARHTLPLDFKISDDVKAWAEKHGYSAYLQAHFEFFVDWARGGGIQKQDWVATFRNCVRADWGDIRKKMSQSGIKPARAADTSCRVDKGGEPCGLPGKVDPVHGFICGHCKQVELERSRKPMPAETRAALGLR